jgi:hypothetical protein
VNGNGGQWWLVTQLPPSRPDSKSDLEIVLELSAEDATQTRAANALLNRLAAATPYARLVELYDELLEAFARDASPARRVAEMNKTARALGKVARELPDDLRRHVADDDLGSGKGEEREFERAIAEETRRPPFRLLVALSELAGGPFAAIDDGIVNDEDAVAALMTAVPDLQPSVDLIRTLRAGVIVAQRLIGRQLQVYEERIVAASLSLRRLAAEVADGAPALMRADKFAPERGETNLGQTTIDPLALDKALYLHRALRHARELLRATDSNGAPEVPDERADAARDEEEARAEAETDAPADAARTDAQPAEEPMPAAEPPPGGRADQVVDLRTLADHTAAFTDELEKAWSGALDHTLLAAAQKEMNARYATLLHSIQRRVAAGDRALRAAGIDPQIPAYPLPPSEIAQLSLEPDDERRWRQLQLAELDALMLLLEALEAMRAPSAQTIYIDQQRVETWWEAGAFALVRARAQLLARVSEQAALAEATVIGTKMEPAASAMFFDRLRLAGDAVQHADVEAALVHARLALRLRAAAEGDDVPADLLQRLADDARLGDEGPLLRLLDEAALKIAAGQPLDVGAAVVLAPRALAVVGRLCLETPDIIADAIRGASRGARS